MSELIASPSVEQQFHFIVQAVEQRLQLLDRLPRVRIKAWLTKLKEEVSSNVTWQRNRNCYARLLLEQLRAGCLEVPFNTMPPEGALPTLPTYLTYRFISPPRQRPSTSWASGVLDDAGDCSSSDARLAGCRAAGLSSRPHSAGAALGFAQAPTPFQPLPAAGAHNSWRVSWASGPAGLSAMSPRRCGSPPNTAANTAAAHQTLRQPTHHTLALQQQQWANDSPRSTRTAGSGRRGHSSATGSPQHQQQQRPRSPGAAGLMDAAAAVAAELDAERQQAACINNRLRFAEDKILQQEAELVRLQGSASAARRRIKSATAATLQELLDRYGGAAAAWTQQQQGASSPSSGSGPAALTDSVYRPVWQLLSGLQSVLDSCDQEEQDWVRARGAAAAAVLQQAYDAHTAATGGEIHPGDGQSLPTGDPASQGTASQQQQRARGSGQGASEAAAAAAAEVTVLQHCERCLQELQQQAEELLAALALKKDEATAAAGGRGSLSAVEVAEAAAKQLKRMLKVLKHEGKDAGKLRRRLEAAAEATDAAAASSSAAAAAAAQSLLQLQEAMLCDDSSNSSSNGSSADSSDSEDADAASSNSSGRRGGSSKRRQLKQQRAVLAATEQQQQQQGARLTRLQSASRVVQELDKACGKLEQQLREAQQKLMGLVESSSGTGSALLSTPMHHHDSGLLAALTAGIAASLSAGLRSFQASVASLVRLLASLKAGATAAAAAAASAGQGAAGGAAVPSTRGGAVDGGTGSSPGRVLGGRSISSRLGDAALAGTWGEQATAAAAAAAGGPGGALLSRSVSAAGRGAYDAAAQYSIGAAAASSGAGRSPSMREGSGRPSGTVTAAAGGAGSLLHGLGINMSQPTASGLDAWGPLGNSSALSSPRGLTTSSSSKAAFTQQLRAGGGAGGGLSGGLGGGVVGVASGGSDAAAEAVHAQLAGLSRQASRLSQRASQVLHGAGSASSVTDVMMTNPGAGYGVGGAGDLRVLTGPGTSSNNSSSFGGVLQRAQLGINTTTTLLSQGVLSPRTAALGGTPGVSAFAAASTGSSSPTGVTAGLLGGGLRGGGGGLLGGTSGMLSPRGATGGLGGIAALGGTSSGAFRPGLGSSSSLPRGGLLGAAGGLSSGSSGASAAASAGWGAGDGLRPSSSVLGKFGPSVGAGGGPGSSSSIAAISSRLQNLVGAGR